MSTTLDLSGLDKRLQQLRGVTNLNATQLMKTWMDIINEDNRRGVLAGTDKDGVVMVPVKYRPKPASKKTVDALKKTIRGGQRANVKQGAYQLMGGAMHNNLTSAQYRLLAGPPLAPRDQFSRVITNLKTTFGGPPYGASHWFAEGTWDDVVSATGIPFLKYHFNGTSRLPRRDLRGVRPQGIAKAMDALRNWARLAVRELFA